MKGNCYIPPRTDEVLSNSFATISALNNAVNDFDSNLNTSINNLATANQSLQSQISGLNLNNIAGTLSVSKGGTNATSAYNASASIMPASWSSSQGTTCGNRSDGSFQCVRYGHFCNLRCRIIVGGSNRYTSTAYLPSGYRPANQMRFPITMMASDSPNGYGHMYLETSGQIRFCTSTSGDAEICADCWYVVPY